MFHAWDIFFIKFPHLITSTLFEPAKQNCWSKEPSPTHIRSKRSLKYANQTRRLWSIPLTIPVLRSRLFQAELVCLMRSSPNPLLMNILYAIMCFQVPPGLGNGSIFLWIEDVLGVLKNYTAT